MCFPQSGKYFASSPGGIASTRYHNQVLPIEIFVYTVDAALVVAVLHLQATQRVHVSSFPLVTAQQHWLFLAPSPFLYRGRGVPGIF